MKLKLLAKQAETHRKALAAKGKEATKLQGELAAAQKKVRHLQWTVYNKIDCA